MRSTDRSREMMGCNGNQAALSVLAVLLLLCTLSLMPVSGHRQRQEEREEEVIGGGGRSGSEAASRGLFILGKSKQVVKTSGGEVRVIKGYQTPDQTHPLHLGFIAMEPNTLFVPQYIDDSIILFIRNGEAKIGWIYKDALVEKQLRAGDINSIPAGSAFYIVNTGKGQRLQIICAFDTSDSLSWSPYQSFFIGGGRYPTSVLAGFHAPTLATAFNVTTDEIDSILNGRTEGPIVRITGDAAEPLRDLVSSIRDEEDGDEEEEDGEQSWTWRELFNSLLGRKKDDRRKGTASVGAPDSYNIYESDPDFKNDYGWSTAVDKHKYTPLEKHGISVTLVSLKAGAMLAPHVNPTAAEYVVVLAGSGTVQVVFPNGTAAMDAEVAEGDSFWIPRYFPFCQVAARDGPMVLFGFTTSARRNRPQLLAGRLSVLRSMMGPELAAGFGVSEERMRRFLEAQKEALILPPRPLPETRGEEAEVAPPVVIQTRAAG